MSKKKFLAPLVIISLLVPQVTFAVWWNPFSWGWFIPKTQKNISVQEVTKDEKIVEIAKNSTSTSLVRDAVFYLSSTNPFEGNIQGYDIDREAFPRDVLADEIPAKVFFTTKDVAIHNSPSDCWVSQSNRVYNLTTLFQHTEIRTHPVVTKLQKLCGTDITKIVNASAVEPGSLNTARVRYAIATLVIGRLSNDELNINKKMVESTTKTFLVDFNNTIGVVESIDPNRGGHYNSQPEVSGVSPLTIRLKVPNGNDSTLVYGDGQDSQTLKQGQFSRETGYSVAGQEIEHVYTKPGTYVIKYTALFPSGIRGDVTVHVKENGSAVKEEAEVLPTTSQSDKMTTYTNQTYGYTMNYPKNWTMQAEAQELRTPNRLLSIVKIAPQDKRRRVSVIVNENEWMMRMEAPKKESVIIDGTEHIAYIFPDGYEGCDSRTDDCSFFVIPIRKGNVWHELHAIGDAKTVTDTYKEIFSSFKFTK